MQQINISFVNVIKKFEKNAKKNISSGLYFTTLIKFFWDAPKIFVQTKILHFYMLFLFRIISLVFRPDHYKLLFIALSEGNK